MNGHQRRWWQIAAILVAATALLPVAVAQASAPVGPSPSHLTFASSYANLNNPNDPNATIVFGSPLPQVDIQPTANTSLGASLALDYLLELAPNTSDPAHPTVVAVASPETLDHFNGTLYPDRSAVNLIATLPVYRASTPLWSNGTAIPPAPGPAQQAILDVNYSVATGSDGSPGVLVTWSVSGWPWAASSGDELALEYVVQVVSGSGFETCTGTSSGNAPATGCLAQSLPQHQAVWGSALTALKGSGPFGSVAWVSWNPTVHGSAAATTAVTAGAYLEQPGTSALVVAAPIDGAGAVSGATLFFISPGSLGGVVGPLVGDLPIYGGAFVVFAVAAAIGIVAYRRRDRAIAEELTA